MKKLFTQMAILTVGRLGGAACVFLITLLLARSFGEEAVASYSLLLSAASILSVLLPLGFHAIATLFAAEYMATERGDHVRAFATYAQGLTLRNAIVLYALGLLGAFLVPFESTYNIPLLVAFSIPTAYAMAVIYLNSALLIGVEKHYSAHLPDMLLRPIILLMILGGLALLGLATDLVVFAALLFAVAIAMFVQLGVLQRTLKSVGPKPLAPDLLKDEKKKWWKLAPSHMKITLLWDYFFEFHLLLAGALLAPGQVAVLFVCFRIRQLAGFGMRSLYSLLMPKMMAANARSDQPEAQRILSFSVRITCTYAVLVWGFLALFGGEILSIFGEAYASATAVLLIMMGTMVARGIFGPASAVLGMARHPNIVVAVLIASLALSIGLCLALVFLNPILPGEQAIALAYFTATTFSSATIWWITIKRTGLNSAIWARRSAA